ncbi:hypothetical protein J3A78_003497 [Streptomyces sp. PvR006]|uniref:hypothetical protein n=1 Tax=Streptomyces sp. PvR006 TaxID=2817860 RepID=UPI001AE416C0|nr:hypothetical protein [Streptomyces sp. PvR006]MBP2583019.1 hypothetical protein [Streptomyces sp. PvR006]
MRRHATTAALAIVLLTLVGCSTSPEPDVPATGSETTAPSTRPEPAKPGKYEQTWTTPYSSTTCSDYLTALDEHQQWVLAADMLSGARSADGATDLPEDTAVDRFQQDMATACEAEATAKTTEVGATLYMLDTTYKP